MNINSEFNFRISEIDFLITSKNVVASSTIYFLCFVSLQIQHQLDSVDMIQNYSRSGTKDPLFMYVSPLTAHQPLDVSILHYKGA